VNLKILDLSVESLTQAPEFDRFPFSCKYCLYWEHPEKMQDTAPGWQERAFKEKLCWIEKVGREFGSCGKILLLDGEGAVYSQYGPPEFFPNATEYPSGPLSEDAVFLACLFVGNKKFSGLGLGKRLLHEIIEELRKKGVEALETFARKGELENPSGPLELYLNSNFHILRDSAEYPLVRLNL